MGKHGEYLGEELVTSLEGTPFEGYGPEKWALEYIGRYGGIDGDHHKTWVIDQTARILLGTPIILKLARWEDGTKEYRFITGEPSKEYLAWVEELKALDEATGEYQYSYDEGIAP